MNELLQKLTEAVGVSGEEKEIRRLIRDLIADHVDEWHADALGNLIAVKKGTGADPLRVMVDAHMDEVGLMIIDIESDGTLRFEKVGGIDDRTLLGKVVQVGPKKITGVIGGRPIHLSSPAERTTVVRHKDMRIDIGAKKKKMQPPRLALVIGPLLLPGTRNWGQRLSVKHLTTGPPVPLSSNFYGVNVILLI